MHPIQSALLDHKIKDMEKLLEYIDVRWLIAIMVWMGTAHRAMVCRTNFDSYCKMYELLPEEKEILADA